MGWWLESDNKAISVQLNSTGTGTGTELSNTYLSFSNYQKPSLEMILVAAPYRSPRFHSIGISNSVSVQHYLGPRKMKEYSF